MASPHLSTPSSDPMQYLGFPAHPATPMATLDTLCRPTCHPSHFILANLPPSPALSPASGPMEYLEEAAQALVGKNFPSDKTDPKWMKADPAGYKGTDKREKDGGFHAKSY